MQKSAIFAWCEVGKHLVTSGCRDRCDAKLQTFAVLNRVLENFAPSKTFHNGFCRVFRCSLAMFADSEAQKSQRIKIGCMNAPAVHGANLLATLSAAGA